MNDGRMTGFELFVEVESKTRKDSDELSIKWI